MISSTKDHQPTIRQVEECICELDYSGAINILELALRSVGPVQDSEPDCLKLRLLYGECCYVVGRWDRAQREFERILERRQGLQWETADANWETVIRALIGQAELQSKRGDSESSMNLLGEARRLAQEKEQKFLGFRLAIEQTEQAGQTGEIEQARINLEKLEGQLPGYPMEDVDYDDELRWARIWAALETQWGLYYFRTSQAAKAEEKFQRALELYQSEAHPSLELAAVYRYLGMMASLQHQYRRALQLHLEGLSLYLKAGYRYGMAKIYDSIGRNFLSSNRLDEASFAFRRAETLSRRLGANAELATIYGKLGQVSMIREDFEGAVRYFKKDLEISSSFKNYYALAYSYRNLGRCLLQIGKYEEAVSNLKEGINLFQYVEDERNLARVLMDLGFAHVKLNQTEEARINQAKALDLFNTHSLRREIAYLQCLNGMVCRAEKNLDEALLQFNQCIEDLQTTSSSAWKAETHYELGLTLKEMGRKDEAVDAFKAAVRTARGSGLSRQVNRYLQELEECDEVQLFEVWLEELPSLGDSGERIPSKI